MRPSLVAFVIAGAIGATMGVGYAQENPKAAAAPPPGPHKQMPVAGTAAAEVPETPGTAGTGPAKPGKDSLMTPVTPAKPAKE